MMRALLEWLACGLVVVLGFVMLNRVPASGSVGARHDEPGRVAVTAAVRNESPRPEGRRAQP
jgi:hypothetical protein